MNFKIRNKICKLLDDNWKYIAKMKIKIEDIERNL